MSSFAAYRSSFSSALEVEQQQQQQHRQHHEHYLHHAAEAQHARSVYDEPYTHRPSSSSSSSSSHSSNSSQYSADVSALEHHPAAHTAKAKPSLANISVPSFGAFRSQLPTAQSSTKQHAALGSPRHASIAIAQPSPRLAETFRPLSLVTAPLHSRSNEQTGLEQPGNRSSNTGPQATHDRNDSIDSRIASTFPSSASTSPQRPTIDTNIQDAHEHLVRHAAQPSTSTIDHSEQYSPFPPESPSSMIALQQAPTMTLQFDGIQRTLSDESLGTISNDSAKRPRSPGGRLGSFFGWKTPHKSDGDSSPTTTFSDRSHSPLPSPQVMSLPIPESEGRKLSARLTPPSLDVQKANAGGAYFDNPQTPLLLGDDASNAHVRELEQELSQISRELAGSIRREMELEDELDRLRSELPTIPTSDLSYRRGSDYFSDSGASSTKFPITDVDAKLDQMDKQLRKVEQEKANLKVEMASRLQTELSRRRDLEELVQNLEDQVDKHNQMDAQRGGKDNKLEELASTLDDTRRRLGQEKMTKENLEDLYKATREELEIHRNEAENLRNEVVPQLKARVEGLESEAADTQALVYENTRLQQELAALRESGHSRFNSIAEEGVASAARISLSRTGSLARSSSLRMGGSANHKEGGRQRSGSLGADGVKEIEDQRDALHKALKLLIKRYEKQTREHERAMKKVIMAKDHAELVTPKRTAYTREVAFLKDEVSTLRKRTEDALEQKWQYEKNLSGLKMDLDRAEQETRGLRIILQENEIGAGSERGISGGDEEALKLSISKAENERDRARRVAEEYRQQAQSSRCSSPEKLMSSAKRMEDLAEQLEREVQANNQLRGRLSAAVAKGEREQKDSTRQIEEMQRRLAGMEDSVLAAQQHSETALANHDAEVRQIENASSPRLSRLTISIPEPNKLGPPSPLLKKSPKLGSKKLSDSSLLEISRTQMLERKVKELEGLLGEAEEDMQVVVQRVNKSQMEVADLQTERDAALIQMRKLQALIIKERENAEALMS